MPRVLMFAVLLLSAHYASIVNLTTVSRLANSFSIDVFFRSLWLLNMW